MFSIKEMNDLKGYIDFWPEFKADNEITEEDFCFIYSAGQVLLKKSHLVEPPSYKMCETVIKNVEQLWYLGEWDGKACYAYGIDKNVAQESVWNDLEWVSVRDDRWNHAMECYQIVIKAQHLLNWDRSTKYCGCCGNLYQRREDERAKETYSFQEFHQLSLLGLRRKIRF